MKKSNIVGAVLVLLIGAFIGGWLMYKFKPLPDGMVIVPQSKVDSLDAYISLADSLELLANLPPDTVKTVQIVYKDSIIYAETTPVPTADSADSSFQVYTDSLHVEGEINAWVTYKVKGYVEGVAKWGYIPIIHEIETTITQQVPYPVIEYVELEVPTYYTGHYLSLAAGGNDKMFTFGVDYDLVKQKYIYGLQYRRYGPNNVYGVKIGINLVSLFKR